LISVINNSINLCYIHWVSTESGPMIMNYGLFNNRKHRFFKNLNTSTLSKINDEERMFSFSLDSQRLLYNQSNQLYTKDINYSNWINNEFELNKMSTKYKVFSYPFNNTELFNIYYSENINQNIFEYVRSKNASIQSISPGIFAAESACRFWYKSKLNKIKNYLVWRSDSKYDQVLFVKDNQFKVLFSFRAFKSEIKIFKAVGNDEDVLKIKTNIETCLYDSKKGLADIEYIFIYQINQNHKKLKYLLNKNNIKNIYLLSPFEVFGSINKPNKNKYILSCFAESGNSFGGIDV